MKEVELDVGEIYKEKLQVRNFLATCLATGKKAGDGVVGNLTMLKALKERGYVAVEGGSSFLTERGAEAAKRAHAFNTALQQEYVAPPDIIKVPALTHQKIVESVAADKPSLLKTADQGWATNGHMAYRINDAEAEEMREAFMLSNVGESWEKALGPEIKRVLVNRSDAVIKIVPEPVAVRKLLEDRRIFYYLKTEDGQDLFVDAKYFNFLKKRYPMAEWRTTERLRPFALFEKDKIVAVMMPVQMDVDEVVVHRIRRIES